jgi:hypothetical protein
MCASVLATWISTAFFTNKKAKCYPFNKKKPVSEKNHKNLLSIVGCTWWEVWSGTAGTFTVRYIIDFQHIFSHVKLILINRQNLFKGTVSWDFSPLVFFIKQLPPGPWYTHKHMHMAWNSQSNFFLLIFPLKAARASRILGPRAQRCSCDRHSVSATAVSLTPLCHSLCWIQ